MDVFTHVTLVVETEVRVPMYLQIDRRRDDQQKKSESQNRLLR